MIVGLLFVAYIDELPHQDSDACITIVMPESIPTHWWERFLHNQTALLFRKNTGVVDVTYHLEK